MDPSEHSSDDRAFWTILESTPVESLRAVSFQVEAMPGSVVFTITAEEDGLRMVMDMPLIEARMVSDMLTAAIAKAN